MTDGMTVLSDAAASFGVAGSTGDGVGDAEECMMSSTAPRFREWLGAARGPRQDVIYDDEKYNYVGLEGGGAGA